MTRRLASLALLGLLPGLSACGFTPVYSQAGLTQSPVEIATIPGRTGHALRRELTRELAAGLPGLASGAQMQVRLDETVGRLAFRPDGAASRSSITLTATYTLRTEDHTVEGNAQAQSLYNVPDGPYGDVSAQIRATEDAARALAREIVLDLRLRVPPDAG